ncbi:MAG: DUF481 domain-containing protein [candidate division KSB1 bacterium]|nr:DUF481 domain-containing protein [candidate division KSB1 bacterium]MDZ7317898.1 DUF481 domain-containing protein [candidate division KSB1 bacterium]
MKRVLFTHRILMLLLWLTPCLVWSVAVASQNQSDSLKQSSEATLKVFIDTPDYFLDFDFLRTEITFVNYVRDRADADVHVLITTQQTGGGGREFTIAFIGLKQFEGNNNTLKYISRQTDTEDDTRRGLVRTIKIGLIQYVAHTAASDRLEINYKPPEEAKTETQKVVDPWNYWTFRTSLRGSFDGEKSYKSNYLNGSFEASRITEDWKINIEMDGSYRENRYDYGEALSYNDIRRNYSLEGEIVKSLGDHWSLGGSASAWRSTYNNTDLAGSISPGVEYSIFPYSESTRRFLTLLYKLRASQVRYFEETIYLKTQETLLYQHLSLSYDIKQPWGSIYTSLEGAELLNDWEKYHVYLFNSLSIRIFKGLSINLFASVSFLRDQISLPRAGATLEEVLLRQRQLETSYNYWTSIGLSYTFGSIYNNIVNPRFGGSGSGRIIYFD